MADGHINKCKPCSRKDTTENRAKRDDYYKAYDRQRGTTEKRKQAAKEYGKSYRKTDARKAVVERYSAKHAERREANIVVGNAIRDGKLIPQPCFMCGETQVDAHHPHYDDALSVVWLCRPHHAEIHRQYDHEDDKLLLDTTVKGSRWSAS